MARNGSKFAVPVKVGPSKMPGLAPYKTAAASASPSIRGKKGKIGLPATAIKPVPFPKAK